MEKLRDPKLWKAVGLGVGLYAFTVTNTVDLLGDACPPAYWETHVWPRLTSDSGGAA